MALPAEESFALLEIPTEHPPRSGGNFRAASEYSSLRAALRAKRSRKKRNNVQRPLRVAAINSSGAMLSDMENGVYTGGQYYGVAPV